MPLINDKMSVLSQGVMFEVDVVLYLVFILYVPPPTTRSKYRVLKWGGGGNHRNVKK